MKTNDKTLADVQPGGMVRLGDQRSDLVPGTVRCAKCQFQLVRSNLNMHDGTVTAGDSKTEPCPNGCGPLWPVTWETWAREGWAEAERLHLENAALSAQPSPGGQGDALLDQARKLFDELGAIADDDKCVAILAAALAARQPVGGAVAYWLAVDKDGIVEFGMSADDGNAGQAARQEVNDFINGPLHDGGVPHRLVGVYAAPPAQADQEYLESLDRALEGVIDERDRYHEMADDLAGHIAAITGVDIGEHSSANCPWQNAIEAAEEYQPAQAVDLDALRRLSDGWLARSEKLSVTQQRKAGAYWACAKELRDWLDSQAVGK